MMKTPNIQPAISPNLCHPCLAPTMAQMASAIKIIPNNEFAGREAVVCICEAYTSRLAGGLITTTASPSSLYSCYEVYTMPQIAIPEKFTANLNELAAQDHRAVEDVVDEAINSYLVFRFHEPQLTSDEIERLKRGVAQLNSGERISGENLNMKFENWRTRRASR